MNIYELLLDKKWSGIMPIKDCINDYEFPKEIFAICNFSHYQFIRKVAKKLGWKSYYKYDIGELVINYKNEKLYNALIFDKRRLFSKRRSIIYEGDFKQSTDILLFSNVINKTCDYPYLSIDFKDIMNVTEFEYYLFDLKINILNIDLDLINYNNYNLLLFLVYFCKDITEDNINRCDNKYNLYYSIKRIHYKHKRIIKLIIKLSDYIDIDNPYYIFDEIIDRDRYSDLLKDDKLMIKLFKSYKYIIHLDYEKYYRMMYGLNDCCFKELKNNIKYQNVPI